MPFTNNENSLAAVSELQLKQSLEKSVIRYHITGLWIAAIFDPVFGFADYINIPHAWYKIFIIRCLVSILSISLIVLHRKYKFPSFYAAYLVFFVISLQNAYTYSLIDTEHFLGHTINYIALFIGAGMFVLWRWYFSVIAMSFSAAACTIFFNLNHNLNFHDALIEGGLLIVVIGFFVIILIQTRYSLIIKTIKANLALANANQELSIQKGLIEAKNTKITDSIKYAQRIQSAILPNIDTIKAVLPNSFVLFKPKDIVSGDFYWFHTTEDKILIAAVDCTGHGVPGAFMSMIGYEILNEIVNVWHIFESDKMLNNMHILVRKALKQAETNNKDGMDLVVCVIDKTKHLVEYSGAKNPLIYIQNNELKEIKGNKMPIGGEQKEEQRLFTKHIIELGLAPTTFYLFTDGYQDQFGGEKIQKFMIRQMRNLFLEIHQQDLALQQQILDQTIETWRGNEKQIDDILIIGMSI